MSELAKSHIDIIDDSSYGAGASAIVPLVVFATKENKVVNEETGEIALGTSKEVANKVIVLTSRKDVVDTYGVPYFYDNDGTIDQSSELNERGLYCLYDALGNASVAYAIRADIDLAQLEPTLAEPQGKVANQSLWFDVAETSYGMFRANGNSRPAIAWDRIEKVLVPSKNELDEGNKPLGTYGVNGDVAIVADEKGQVLYENIASEWFEIGSKEWIAQFPSSAKGSKEGTYEEGYKITINDIQVTLRGASSASKIDDAVRDINGARIPNVVAKNVDGALYIENTKTLLKLVQDEDKALEKLGFKVEGDNGVVDAVSLVHKSHSQVPSGAVAGSMWMKTTEPNYGAKYVMKRYNSSSDSWKSITMPMYGSLLDAEKSLGVLLNADTMIVKYDDENLAKSRILQYGSLGLKVTGTVANPEIVSGQSIQVRTIVDGEIKTYAIKSFSTSAELFVKAFNNAKIPTLVADLTSDGYIRIVSSTGNTIEFSDVNGGNILSTIGIASGESSKWTTPVYKASEYELTSDADLGTYWFNDSLNVDIMVNDGSKWVGYKNLYECAVVFKSAEEPQLHEDGSPLVENDLWINTASANYPEIYRYYDNSWELIDVTDQSTPLGMVFADARENAGPAYAESKHVPFSTKEEDMMVSDYVDPECVNPLTYPAGIILFNTLYSTNNVKVYENKYQNTLKEIGGTYKVGESVDFSTPGSSNNPKTTRWSTISGNDENGSGLFGNKAQRAMVVRALAEAINSNDDIRSTDYDFFFATCPGYPELDDELIRLNTDKKDMFYIISDTPSRLAPKANDIIAWGSNKNNASKQGEEGRVLKSAYVTRQYPSMGLTSNVDGADVAVPSSVAKLKNLLILPRGMFAAGTTFGQVRNLASVGYINEENEYEPVTVKDGLGNIIVGQSMNPIMPQRNTGLLFWGENTENPYTSSLSDEHAILTILRLKRELDSACLPFFFRPNTESLRRDFDAVLRAILNDYVAREELYDYTLVTDRSVNTNERINRKELWANVAIEIVKGVEQIYIPIRVVATGALS